MTERVSSSIEASYGKYIKSLGVELECCPPGNRRSDPGVPNAENLEMLVEEMKHRKFRTDYVAECLHRIYKRHFSYGGDGSIDSGDENYDEAELRFWDTSDNGFKDVFELLDFCYNIWKVRTNSTCGFHIHIKFKDRDMYSLLSYENVHNKWVDMYCKTFGSSRKYLNRLSCHYCIALYDRSAADTVTTRFFGSKSTPICGERYRAINFMSLVESQRTLEFRLFPYQKDFKESKKTIDWFVDSINELFDNYVVDRTLISTKLYINTSLTNKVENNVNVDIDDSSNDIRTSISYQADREPNDNVIDVIDFDDE